MKQSERTISTQQLNTIILYQNKNRKKRAEIKNEKERNVKRLETHNNNNNKQKINKDDDDKRRE